MNLSKILNDTYITYFSYENCDIEHRIFRAFLYDMSAISIDEDINGFAPLNPLKIIMNRFNYSSNYYAHIKDVVPHMQKFTELEVFTLLYFCCSKNNFNFSEMFCVESANNGTIYHLLKKLKELQTK